MDTDDPLALASSDPRALPRRPARPINRAVELSERKFDVETLPHDLRRVYGHLAAEFGEEYGLLFVFTMRTAVELHRAWHMTLLTSNLLQQIKDEFGLRTTWNLGVVRLKFRVEDGGYELHRKVPYDYDSEFQDIFSRIALALVGGHITVHEALVYQTEAQKGIHTARAGLFLRDFPGRLVLYPLQASMCAVIFFGGQWTDAAVAAVCGLAAGLVEYALSHVGGQATVLLDVLVGISTGIIGGLWHHHVQKCCLPAIFLGTLYWFFYGTAFVIGLLEIIAGELETGVTRFVAVSVKTFVLSLGASIGLMVAHGGEAAKTWFMSEAYCEPDFVVGKWWRIPIYLACSVGVLGQYRMQVDRYWCALLVQLVAYQVQYGVFQGIEAKFSNDDLDTAASNIAGAAAGVFIACALSYVINLCRQFYSERLLQKDERENGRLSKCVYRFMRGCVKVFSCIGMARRSEIQKLQMKKKISDQNKELHDPAHPRNCIDLDWETEDLFLETIVSSQDINIWSILMPAVYQLVPGSIIAKFWFHAIFHPPEDAESKDNQGNVFSNLMVISASLALGLIFGFAIVQCFSCVVGRLRKCCCKETKERAALRKRRANMMEGMYTAGTCGDDDPSLTFRDMTE